MLTKAMLRALKAAAQRERGTICPIRGVHGFAEEALLQALIVRGLAEFSEERGPNIPVISATGRAAANAS